MRHWSLVFFVLAVSGCMQSTDHDLGDLPMFTVTSSAFDEGTLIPAVYTCDGEDHSIPLAFTGLPDNASYIAVIFDDPDAPVGTWTHWTFWDLPVSVTDISADTDVTALGATVGQNSWGRSDYGGPCPPDKEHRYFVHAFATTEPIGLPAGAPVEDVWETLEEAAIAKATLMGRYDRPDRG